MATENDDVIIESQGLRYPPDESNGLVTAKDLKIAFLEFRQGLDIRFQTIEARFQPIEQKLGIIELKLSFILWGGGVVLTAILAGIVRLLIKV